MEESKKILEIGVMALLFCLAMTLGMIQLKIRVKEIRILQETIEIEQDIGLMDR